MNAARSTLALTGRAAAPAPARGALRAFGAVRRAARPARAVAVRATASKATGSEPWHATAREAMDEVVLENCMEALVEGDAASLKECLIGAEAEIENEELNDAKQNPKNLHNYLESHKQDFKQQKKK